RPFLLRRRSKNHHLAYFKTIAYYPPFFSLSIYRSIRKAVSIKVSRFRRKSGSSICTGTSTPTPGSICSPFRSMVCVTESLYCQPLGNSPEEGAPPPPPV